MNYQYSDYMKLSNDLKLMVFMSSLSLTNRTPEYYVNWKKVSNNTKEYELELNTLNYLIGKDNIYQEALALFTKQPQLIKVIPTLIACRVEKKQPNIDILTFDEDYNMEFESLDFININEDKIEFYVEFAQNTGLLDFLANEANKSLVDYVYGVEVGLDSNGRKNRSGTTMESIVESFIKKASEIVDIEYFEQASAPEILSRYNIEIPVDKSTRRFDFAVYNKNKHKLWLIETNYYGSGGSKLKSVSGEFTELNSFIHTSRERIELVWITDGLGWKTAHLPLLEAFAHIDNIFNIQMMNDDYLVDLFQ